MARNMSDAEIRRRKKAQGAISRTTATLGLGGLAMLGAAKATGTKPGFLKPVAKPVTRAVRRAGLTTEQLKNASTNTAVLSGGIGGAGGYNFAAYTSAESKKRVKKNDDSIMEMGHYGEVSKAWEPSNSKYNPAKQKESRLKAAEGAAYGAAGGAAGIAIAEGRSANRAFGRAKFVERYARASQPAGGTVKGKKSGKAYTAPRKGGGVPGEVKGELRALRTAGRVGRRNAAGMAIASAASLGAGAAARNHRKKTFGKSAFGVEHD